MHADLQHDMLTNRFQNAFLSGVAWVQRHHS